MVNLKTPLFSLRAFPAISRTDKSRHSQTSFVRPPSLRYSPPPPPNLHHTTGSLSSSPFLSSTQVRDREIALKQCRGAYRMDCTIIAGKKKVSKSAVIRNKCRTRLREAIRLIVMRGARPSERRRGEEQEERTIVFEEGNEGSRKWLVRGKLSLPLLFFGWRNRN